MICQRSTVRNDLPALSPVPPMPFADDSQQKEDPEQSVLIDVDEPFADDCQQKDAYGKYERSPGVPPPADAADGKKIFWRSQPRNPFPEGHVSIPQTRASVCERAD